MEGTRGTPGEDSQDISAYFYKTKEGRIGKSIKFDTRLFNSIMSTWRLACTIFGGRTYDIRQVYETSKQKIEKAASKPHGEDTQTPTSTKLTPEEEIILQFLKYLQSKKVPEKSQKEPGTPSTEASQVSEQKTSLQKILETPKKMEQLIQQLQYKTQSIASVTDSKPEAQAPAPAKPAPAQPQQPPLKPEASAKVSYKKTEGPQYIQRVLKDSLKVEIEQNQIKTIPATDGSYTYELSIEIKKTPIIFVLEKSGHIDIVQTVEKWKKTNPDASFSINGITIGAFNCSLTDICQALNMTTENTHLFLDFILTSGGQLDSNKITQLLGKPPITIEQYCLTQEKTSPLQTINTPQEIYPIIQKVLDKHTNEQSYARHNNYLLLQSYLPTKMQSPVKFVQPQPLPPVLAATVSASPSAAVTVLVPNQFAVNFSPRNPVPEGYLPIIQKIINDKFKDNVFYLQKTPPDMPPQQLICTIDNENILFAFGRPPPNDPKIVKIVFDKEGQLLFYTSLQKTFGVNPTLNPTGVTINGRFYSFAQISTIFNMPVDAIVDSMCNAKEEQHRPTTQLSKGIPDTIDPNFLEAFDAYPPLGYIQKIPEKYITSLKTKLQDPNSEFSQKFLKQRLQRISNQFTNLSIKKNDVAMLIQATSKLFPNLPNGEEKTTLDNFLRWANQFLQGIATSPDFAPAQPVLPQAQPTAAAPTSTPTSTSQPTPDIFKKHLNKIYSPSTIPEEASVTIHSTTPLLYEYTVTIKGTKIPLLFNNGGLFSPGATVGLWKKTLSASSLTANEIKYGETSFTLTELCEALKIPPEKHFLILKDMVTTGGTISSEKVSMALGQTKPISEALQSMLKEVIKTLEKDADIASLQAYLPKPAEKSDLIENPDKTAPAPAENPPAATESEQPLSQTESSLPQQPKPLTDDALAPVTPETTPEENKKRLDTSITARYGKDFLQSPDSGVFLYQNQPKPHYIALKTGMLFHLYFQPNGSLDVATMITENKKFGITFDGDLNLCRTSFVKKTTFEDWSNQLGIAQGKKEQFMRDIGLKEASPSSATATSAAAAPSTMVPATGTSAAAHGFSFTQGTKSSSLGIKTQKTFNPKDLEKDFAATGELKSSTSPKTEPGQKLQTLPIKPVVNCISRFIKKTFLEKLMKGKTRNQGFEVKYNPRGESYDACFITPMEGLMHTFATSLIGGVRSFADHFYFSGHKAIVFDGKERRTIISTNIHPDCETKGNTPPCQKVFLKLAEITDTELVGEDSCPDVLSDEDRKDPAKVAPYDDQILKYLVYHLTSDHVRPSIRNIERVTVEQAQTLINTLISQKTNHEEIQRQLKNKAITIGDQTISLEILYNSYIEQLQIELSALEELTDDKGYIYTIDPPSIFMNGFEPSKSSATDLFNRFQCLALTSLCPSLKKLKKVIFAGPPDQAIPIVNLYNSYHPNLAIFKEQIRDQTTHQLRDDLLGQAAVVIHNNGDGFYMNLSFEEGDGSLDPIIGQFSDARASLLPDRNPNLTTNVIQVTRTTPATQASTETSGPTLLENPSNLIPLTTFKTPSQAQQQPATPSFIVPASQDAQKSFTEQFTALINQHKQPGKIHPLQSRQNPSTKIAWEVFFANVLNETISMESAITSLAQQQIPISWVTETVKKVTTEMTLPQQDQKSPAPQLPATAPAAPAPVAASTTAPTPTATAAQPQQPDQSTTTDPFENFSLAEVVKTSGLREGFSALLEKYRMAFEKLPTDDTASEAKEKLAKNVENQLDGLAKTDENLGYVNTLLSSFNVAQEPFGSFLTACTKWRFNSLIVPGTSDDVFGFKRIPYTVWYYHFLSLTDPDMSLFEKFISYFVSGSQLTDLEIFWKALKSPQYACNIWYTKNQTAIDNLLSKRVKDLKEKASNTNKKIEFVNTGIPLKVGETEKLISFKTFIQASPDEKTAMLANENLGEVLSLFSTEDIPIDCFDNWVNVSEEEYKKIPIPKNLQLPEEKQIPYQKIKAKYPHWDPQFIKELLTRKFDLPISSFYASIMDLVVNLLDTAKSPQEVLKIIPKELITGNVTYAISYLRQTRRNQTQTSPTSAENSPIDLESIFGKMPEHIPSWSWKKLYGSDPEKDALQAKINELFPDKSSKTISSPCHNYNPINISEQEQKYIAQIMLNHPEIKNKYLLLFLIKSRKSSQPLESTYNLLNVSKIGLEPFKYNVSLDFLAEK